MRIAFVWFGIDGRYGKWKDGLWKAMQLIEQQHEVRYFEPKEDIIAWKPDVVLFWEAACTINGPIPESDMYKKIHSLPCKKILLFAGGPLEAMWVYQFDMILVESAINEEDCERQGLKYMRAFGVNDDIFKPANLPKIFDATMQATCASWKRQGLLAEALKERVVFCGRDQKSDPQPFIDARKYSLVLPDLPMDAVATLINSSHTVVNTASFWGGGQRCTLEALACNVPVIAMTDSPKNAEYVRESGCGVVCEPTVEAIRRAVDEVKQTNYGTKGIDYIQSKWTARHYADSILRAIEAIK